MCLPQVLHVAVAILRQEVAAYLLDITNVVGVDGEAHTAQTAKERMAQQERNLTQHPRHLDVAVAYNFA